MTAEEKSTLTGRGLDLAEMGEIASNVVTWQRRQAAAFEERPLAYIDCLLEKIGEIRDVCLEYLPEEIARLIPGLQVDACIALVGTYLDGVPKRT